MRHLMISTAICLIAVPVWAEQITASAPVKAVTLYTEGASVTRLVTVSPPAGKHEIIIPGFPSHTDLSRLEVSAEGATIGPVSLQSGRTLPIDPVGSTGYEAARVRYEKLQSALNARDTETAAIRARAQAAEDSIAFLMQLAGSDSLTGQDLSGIMDTAGAQLLQARETAIKAKAEAEQSEQGRDRDVEALERARRALEALAPIDAGQKSVVIQIETNEEPAQISITSFDNQAAWQPVYDMRLNRKTERLTLDRGILLSQATGEDWTDVVLTLSTARPMQQVAPSTLSSWFPQLVDQNRSGNSPLLSAGSDFMAAEQPAPVMKNEITADTRWMGATVVYEYPGLVTIRTDVDAIRLSLDSRELTPEIRATAVPQRDSSTYLVAETTNTLDEVILPGQMTLYVDGVLVGQDSMALVPAGETMRLGFGPIDGLIAEFEIPELAEGGRGFINKSNISQQKRILRLRNLTGETWPLRVISQIPVPTQDELKLAWSAEPQPTGQDPEGQRGLIYWDQTIAPQEQQDITLSIALSWPEGKTLEVAPPPFYFPIP